MHKLTQADLSHFDYFELTPDLVCITGKDGFFKKINKAFTTTLQYPASVMLKKPVESFIHPDDREFTAARRAALLKGEPLTNVENRLITKKGETVWLEWTSVYLPEKEWVFSVAKNISARKAREKAVEEKYLKFKNLAINFKQKLEKDRKYFAIELQEELAQLGVVIKMSIAAIEAQLPHASAQLKEKIDHSYLVAEMLINTVKRIAFNIGPYILDNLGLEETLNWFCKEFSILFGIPCSFSSSFDDSELPHEIKVDFFRICQESLSNVVQHAEASSVKVNIAQKGRKLSLTITDDGKGFTRKKAKKNPGLAIMHDLATSINADLSIKSKPGKGTAVTITWKKEEKKKN